MEYIPGLGDVVTALGSSIGFLTGDRDENGKVVNILTGNKVGLVEMIGALPVVGPVKRVTKGGLKAVKKAIAKLGNMVG